MKKNKLCYEYDEFPDFIGHIIKLRKYKRTAATLNARYWCGGTYSHELVFRTHTSCIYATGIEGVDAIYCQGVFLMCADSDIGSAFSTAAEEYYGEVLPGRYTPGLTCPAPMYSVSYRCLLRLLRLSVSAAASYRKLARMLVSGELRIVSVSPDVSKKQLTCPGPGFTVVARDSVGVPTRWHRSGSLLFYNRATRMYYLVGRDDDQYFGCEFSGSNIKTLDQAYVALIPEPIRTRVKSIFRQGEWFFAPLTKHELRTFERNKHKFVQVGLEGSLPRSSIYVLLQRDSADNNAHMVCNFDNPPLSENPSWVWFDPVSGVIYVTHVAVHHDNHATLRLDDDRIYRVYRNTAIRSVSEEGVD